MSRSSPATCEGARTRGAVSPFLIVAEMRLYGLHVCTYL